ncbi:MAG: glycerol-3-phosphate dehydrogenase [Pseudonocardiales bacterium]|jgi:glycerol-3-phosphate dehydrogenase|nr:glycerol-3-phosphate dehydrogenase [Pseudonocardiales bacterium]
MTQTTVEHHRARALAELNAPFDLIVVGGGCNGAGSAWDAATRGLRVLLLEKEDFGWGTSAWNSRLIHGGLKYLEKYDVKLVRESLKEREWLLRAAPHLVKPLRFVLPFYERNAHHRYMLRTGMLAYDVLSFDKSVPTHRVFSPAETAELVPGIDRDGLQGSAAYYDGQVEYAERLSVEVALAAREAGAVVLNHARVDRLLTEGDRVVGVEITDLVSGGTHRASAPVTVNAAGPWLDEVMGRLDGPTPERMTGGTKGTHLVVAPFPGAPRDAMYYEAITDARPLLVIPWLGNYLLGSTDERFAGDPDTVSTDDDEIAYVLQETNKIFPGIDLGPEHVLWAYEGVRPLPFSPAGPTSDISRRHDVRDHAPQIEGLLSVVGGKLTTFRQLGEDVSAAVLRKLGVKRRPSVTRRLQFPGARTADLGRFAAAFRADSGLPAPTVDRLLKVYGTRAAGVAAIAAVDPALAEVIDQETGAVAAEVVFAVRDEMAATLADVVARRSMLGLSADLGVGALDAVASVAEKYAGWSAERASEDRAAYLRYITRFRPRAAV